MRLNSSITRVVFLLPDGTSHDLFGTGDNAGLKTTSCASPGQPFNRGRDFVSRDGAAFYFRSETDIIDTNFDVAGGNSTGGATGDLVTRDGTRYRLDEGRVSSIRDRNGNLITLAYPPGDLSNPAPPPSLVVDSLGRATHVDPSGDCTGDQLTFAGSGGVTRTVTVCRTSLGEALAPGQSLRTLGELFPEIADRFIAGYPLPSTVYDPSVVSRVELPDGRQYTFRYTSYGRVARIVLPTGGSVEYDYAPTDVNLASLSVRQKVAQRRMISAAGGLEQRTVYSPAPAAPPNSATQVSTRDGSGAELARETHAFFGIPDQPPPPGLPTNYGKEFRAEVFQGGTLLRRTEHDWSNSGGAHDFAIVEERVSLHDGPAPITARKTFAYDGFTNRISTTEFAFDGTTAVRRRCTLFVTDSSYTSFPTHLISLPSREVVYQGQGGNAACGGDGVARTSYSYDGSGLTDRPDISGHDAAYGTGLARRGNVTSVRRVIDAGQAPETVSQYRYDIAGNVTRSIDPRGFATNIEYDGPTFAFPVRVTNALGHQSHASFDDHTGQRTQQTDPNGVTTDFEYDDDLERLTAVVAASNDDDAKTRTQYAYLDDERIVRAASDLRQFGDGQLVTETEYDGFGRVLATRQDTPEGPVTVETRYDGLGRVSQVSNPHRNEAAAFTTTTYDALGRVREVQTPDGAETVTAYAGAETTVTDPVGHARRSRSDALGRVTRVVEDPGQANLTTDYTYDVLDNLRTVLQGGPGGQTRTFEYDALSRLKSASNPESGLTRYAKYDAAGNLTQRVDARGVQTDYGYDNLGRIQSRSYSGGAGAAATESVTYSYDQGGSHPVGRLARVATGTSQAVFGDYDALGRVTAHVQRTNGRFYGTAYEYNRAGLLTGETYPSGRSISIQYDDAGRIAGVIGSKPLHSDIEFVTPGDVSYASHGAITGMRLGNGLWESTDFNARLQPTAIRLGTATGGDDRLRLTYGYHPPGSASANNGNVYDQTIVAAGRSFVQSYTYDGLNRLKTADEQAGGVGLWDQTYNFDAFGNRRVGGYLPSPSLSPTQNGHIDHDTNRLLMGTSYDAAGNLTVDPAGRAFSYDGENRQVAFAASGPGALPVSYGYDGDGRRVFKKETGRHTFVYVYDALGRLVTEHSDEDPALPAKDYVYAGSRLIAEVKGSIPGGGLGLIGPVGIIDNCAGDFDFKWYHDPTATHYKLRIDGVVLDETVDATFSCFVLYNGHPACFVEPEASPLVEPFKPGQHQWAVQPLYGNEEGPWSQESYYVIGPRLATPLEPSDDVSSPPTIFRWRHSPGASEYQLYVDRVQKASFDPDEVCGPPHTQDPTECIGTPQPPLTLGVGRHEWRIHSVFPECVVSSLPLHFTLGENACGIARDAGAR